LCSSHKQLAAPTTNPAEPNRTPRSSPVCRGAGRSTRIWTAVDIAIDVAPIDWDAIYMAAIRMAAIRIAAIARDAPDATEFNLAAVGVTAIDWGTIDIAVFARDAFGVAAIGVAAITTDAFDAVTFGLAGRAWNPRCFALGPPLRPRSCIDMARAHRHRASGRPAERTRRRA
jgi:hypothetical protein